MDLTKGSVRNSWVKLAKPLIFVNIVNIVFGLLNVYWLANISTAQVAASGVGALFSNLGSAVFSIIIIGAGIKIAHAIGEKDDRKKQSYINTSTVLTIGFIVIFIALAALFAPAILDIYNLDSETLKYTQQYLVLSIFAFTLLCFNMLFTTIMTSHGKTKIVSKIMLIGVILNIIFDPIFIHYFQEFFNSGIAGSVIATIISRVIILVLFVYYGKGILTFNFKDISWKDSVVVFKTSYPVTIQRTIFVFTGMIMAAIVAYFGSEAIAAQKIGFQVEMLNYMMIGGMQGAITAMIGQNYGAKQFDRVEDSYKYGLKIAIIWGLLITAITTTFAYQIAGALTIDDATMQVLAQYLFIIGFSQVFASAELYTVGALNGMGKTKYAPINSVILTVIRIPLSIWWGSMFGIAGVWLAISITTVAKGIILTLWYRNVFKKTKENEQGEPAYAN